MEKSTQGKLEIPGSSSLFQTAEKEGKDSNHEILLEPVYPESYDLSYTCLLIPRFPSHQLRGDLADYLPQWLEQICISYGWRLKFITVSEEYLQWAIGVSPTTTPDNFMHQIRHDTSDSILSNFGRIRKENLSNDFWAPGYLVVLGTRPHPEEMIAEYIFLTRRIQGLVTF
ncbi:MAG: transposase [Anaerolineales bacterium]|nr:transposase [Anaerolineales bacterium]